MKANGFFEQKLPLTLVWLNSYISFQNTYRFSAGKSSLSKKNVVATAQSSET